MRCFALLFGGLLWAVCGSGKTNVIKRIARYHSWLGYRVIIVVPWLALMDMFYVKSDDDLAALGDPFEISSRRPQGTTDLGKIEKNIQRERRSPVDIMHLQEASSCSRRNRTHWVTLHNT